MAAPSPINGARAVLLERIQRVMILQLPLVQLFFRQVAEPHSHAALIGVAAESRPTAHVIDWFSPNSTRQHAWTPPYGAEFLPHNFPGTVLRRGDSLPIAAFYSRLFDRSPSAQTENLEHAGGADASDANDLEKLAGITDSCDLALVIPSTRVHLLRSRFPGLRIRHWESTHSAFSVAHRRATLRSGATAGISQTNYHAVVDTCSDTELWDGSGGDCAFAAAEQQALAVDVLIHAPYSHPHAHIAAELSTRMWSGRTSPLKYPDEWKFAGKRHSPVTRHDSVDAKVENPSVDASMRSSPIIVVCPAGTKEFSQTFEAHRLPVDCDLKSGFSLQPHMYRDVIHHAADAVSLSDWIASLALAGVDWNLPSPVNGVKLLQLPSSNQNLIEPEPFIAAREDSVLLWGSPQKKAPKGVSSIAKAYALPIAPSAVAAALLDTDDVAAGRVLLIDARLTEAGMLRLPPSQAHRLMLYGGNDSTCAALWADAKASKAHSLIFYCNHAHSASPASASAFHKWQMAHVSPARPDELLRVRVLAGGVGALIRWASLWRPDRMDDLFIAYDKGYCVSAQNPL